jgi:hypothetical protein
MPVMGQIARKIGGSGMLNRISAGVLTLSRTTLFVGTVHFLAIFG